MLAPNGGGCQNNVGHDDARRTILCFSGNPLPGYPDNCLAHVIRYPAVKRQKPVE